MATMTPTMASDISPDRYTPVGCLALPSPELASKLHAYRGLSNAGWIRVESIVSSHGNFTVARIYVLPDDLENGRLDRSDARLRKSRDKLLASLDFSSDTWHASRIETYHENPPQPQPFPSPAPSAHLDDQSQDQGQNMSLLQIFNSIPSPSPDINTITDWTAHEFMSLLLDGTIPGITTELYPYQRRSAALMHQRETAPAPTLDPRFCQVLDQNQNPYYYDSVSGEIRRDPRYYDAPRGGILAEEMGSGKTLICLALITATKDQPAEAPEIYQVNNTTIRSRIASLMDMAAAIATQNSFPWRRYLDTRLENCIKAIKRNPGYYYKPRPQSSRRSRFMQGDPSPYKIYLSHATFIVVPINLLEQWTQEIQKHAPSLQVHIVKTGNDKATQQPTVHDLIDFDIVLCSIPTLEALWQNHNRQEQDGSWTLKCVFGLVRYKRCIVDEGHKLGTPGLTGPTTSLLRCLDALHIDARWIVTGTPSKGLFGVEQGGAGASTLNSTVAKQERQDLERIGSMVTWYLKARPWSNTFRDSGDTTAAWRAYIMQPSHGRQSGGRRDCLRVILNSLIVRHRLSEVSHLLPDVDAKVVRLEGSYQDKLALNIFSMVIIFNAVQSERTDRDYLFHPSNRKHLLELVSNLRQATFFGGPFYSIEDIGQAVETAEEFLQEKKIPIGASDKELLRSAIDFGKVAALNEIKDCANRFHEMPILVQHFPCITRIDWSLDGRGQDEGGLLCTHAQRMVAVQKLLRPFLESPTGLHTYLNGSQFEFAALKLLGEERERMQWQAKKSAATMLAGKTKLGEEHLINRKHFSTPITDESIPTPPHTPETSLEIAAPVANTQLVSTISAKLSYLVDAIVKHQKDEQIIIFYENDNMGYYLASILEMLQVQHLIYAKKLSSARRAQYITTFNHSKKFRVLCMDISQAAFGLDLRSASRIYFVSPVHDPQVEAQAIGRVRRISQQKKVTVETLVLKDSLEEVIVERKHSMSQAEHRNCKTILDDRPVYDWIRNAKIVPLPKVDIYDGPSQMAPLAAPQLVFGREFGREISHPDEDILLYHPATAAANVQPSTGDAREIEAEATHLAVPRIKFGRMQKVMLQSPTPGSSSARSLPTPTPPIQAAKRARFADEAGEGSSAWLKVAPASEHSEMLPTPPAKRIRFSEAS